jgi:hypothetical protein
MERLVKNLDAERATYRENFRWYWRRDPPDGGRTYGDPAGFAFPPGLRSLARECAQNSSDAKLETEPTAVLEFTAIELMSEPLELFKRAINWEELKPHLLAAVENVDRAQAAQSILPAIEMIDNGCLQLIRVADEATTGLTGDEFGKSKFVAVMRNTLDSDKSETSGGSFGLGKATMAACSRIGLVLSCSNLVEPHENKRLGRVIGRIGLPWHELIPGNGGYAGPGWLGEFDEQRGTTVSCWGNETLMQDLFLSRDASCTGTSFLIVAAYDNSGQAMTIEEMASELECGVAESFWPAMVGNSDKEPRLHARVRAMRNYDVVLDNYVDPAHYFPAKVEMLRRYYGDETVDSINEFGDVAMSPAILAVPPKVAGTGQHGKTEHDAILLVTHADDAGESSEPINTVTYMRGSRMVVMEKKVTGLAVGALPFHALVLAGEAAIEDEDAVIAERFLRAAEPPEHNNWLATQKVTNNYDPRLAKQTLGQFMRAVQDRIREIVSTPLVVQSDGPDALRELLRLKTSSVRQEKQPKVKTAGGSIRADGSWRVWATITVPRRDDGRVWVFDPIVRFASDSGPAVSVAWKELRGANQCIAVSGRSIMADSTARTVRIEGETVPDSQPVNGKFASIQMDVAKARGEVPA